MDLKARRLVPRPHAQAPSCIAAGRAAAPVRGPPEVAIDRSGNAIIAMLEQAGGRLAAAQARIGELMTEVESTHERATRAEAWLHLLESEIVDRLVVPPQGS